MIKGVILAGGSGTRLRPMTKGTSKQLLPLYTKPMIYFPIQTLLDAGVKDILIIVAPEHAGDFINLLGSGKGFGEDINFSYEVQDKPLGLAHGLGLARSFAYGHKCSLILGDNLFIDTFKADFDEFDASGQGAVIFATEVPDPHRFGVIEFDENMDAISIEEKPEHPKSNYAQTGLYIYDEHVFDYIDQLTPSPRGELEITDLHKIYLEKDALKASLVKGVWQDTGTFESMFEAASIVRDIELNKN